mgnify:CR=1 FL=1
MLVYISFTQPLCCSTFSHHSFKARIPIESSAQSFHVGNTRSTPSFDREFQTERMGHSKRNLICNFRAQTIEDWDHWVWFKDWCQDRGLTTCRPVIAFISSFRRSIEGLEEGLQKKGKRELLNAFPFIVALEQQNTFIYQLDKPRRTPKPTGDLFLRNNYRTITMTVRRRLSYILDKARYLTRQGQRTWCFRDFMEIQHCYFRKDMQRLIDSGEIVKVEPRTNPRFYMLIDPEGN